MTATTKLRFRAGPSWLRVAIVCAACLPALWIVIGVTLTLTMGRREPARALAWWPAGADSRAAAAERLLVENASPADLERAATLAEGALRREPLNVSAARTLGFARVRQGNLGAGIRLLDYSERLSRRDLRTQLWQIEHSVAMGDIPGALRHYDYALRTSKDALDMLLPTLVRAADDPAVLAPLVEMLRGNPPWARYLLSRAAAESQNLDSLVTMARTARLDPASSVDVTIVGRIVGRLIDAQRFRTAFDLYGQLKGRSPAAHLLLRNGGFEAEDLFPPIEWLLQDTPTLSAIRESHSDMGGAFALAVTGRDGRSGEVARQMLILSPGGYSLTGRIQTVSGDAAGRPDISMTCLDSGAVFLTAKLPAGGTSTAPFKADFTVPATPCAAQTLSIAVSSAEDTAVWLDQLAITRR